MSDNNTVVPIKSIIAPSLNSAEYGSQLKGVFENIDANFKLLGNTDFIKGETGNSAKIKKESFFDIDAITGKKKLTRFGLLLMKAIDPFGQYERNDDTGAYTFLPSNTGIYTDVNGVSWYSYFVDDRLTDNHLYVIYGEDGNSGVETPFTSLYYVFLDGRFASDTAFDAVDSEYDEIEDLSCIAVYNYYEDADRFDIIKNAFPTMYYEDTVGLCWKVNGAKSGMPVRGIPGKNGHNSTLHIVKGERISDTDEYEITSIYNKDEFVSADYEQLYDLDGQAAVVLANSERLMPSIDVTTGKPNLNADGEIIYTSQPALVFYFGQLYKDEEVRKIYSKCNSSNAVNIEFSFNEFYNTLRNIDLYGDSAHGVLKGLFLPINKANAVHLFTAADTTGQGGTASNRHDLIMTPINDINTFDVEFKNADDLNIDKYLYVTYNKGIGEVESSHVEKSNLQNLNYTLKYKLINIANYNTVWNNLFFYNTDLSNVCYPTYQDGVITGVSSDHIDSMPQYLQDKLSKGIYVWELNNEKDPFDVDEFNGNTPVYNLPDKMFKYVFTDTSSPGIGSDIFYFNALDTINDKINTNNIDLSGKSLVYGWDADVFSFLKYVPICVSTSKYDNDVSLTVNYDVNITGDDNNHNRTLTVTGDINCDNIKVYKLSASKEIQNIFTNDDIIGNSGIKLSKSKDTSSNGDKYLFTVSGDTGDVVASNIDANNIDVNSIVSNAIDATDISCNSVSISSDAGDTLLDASSIDGFDKLNADQFDYDNSLDLNLHSTHAIQINKHKLDDDKIRSIRSRLSEDEKTVNSNDYIDYMSNIQSDMPIIMKSGSNITITDTDDITQVWTGTTMTNESISMLINQQKSAGENIVNFDSVKNYMMLKLTDDINSNGVVENVSYKISRNADDFKESIIDISSDIGWDSNKALVRSAESNEAIARFKIDVSADTALNMSKITMSLGSYSFVIKLNSSCSHGNWPYLTDDSRVILHVYYSIGTNGTKKLLTSTGSYIFNDVGQYWLGYDANGNLHQSNNKKDWAVKDRYYSYTFNPYDIVLGNESIKSLIKAYNESKGSNSEIKQSIYLYVIPEIHIAHHSDNQQCIYHSEVFGFMPKHNSTKNPLRNIERDTEFINQTVKQYDNNNLSYVNETLTYALTKFDSNESDFAITTMCKDGIVFKSGNAIFGLGYCNDYTEIKATDGKYNAIGATDNNGNWVPLTYKYPSTATALFKDGPVLFYMDVSSINSYKDFIKDQIIERKFPLQTNESPNSRFNNIIKAIPLNKLYDAINISQTSSVAYYGV